MVSTRIKSLSGLELCTIRHPPPDCEQLGNDLSIGPPSHLRFLTLPIRDIDHDPFELFYRTSAMDTGRCFQLPPIAQSQDAETPLTESESSALNTLSRRYDQFWSLIAMNATAVLKTKVACDSIPNQVAKRRRYRACDSTKEPTKSLLLEAVDTPIVICKCLPLERLTPTRSLYWNNGLRWELPTLGRRHNRTSKQADWNEH